MTPRQLLLLLSLSYWPVWVWYFERLTDGSDEPLGVIALLTLGALLLLTKRAPAVDCSKERFSAATPVILLLAYGLAAFLAPQAVQALVAITTIALIASGPARCFKLNPGGWMLVGLSLPVVATANFYSGFPLRCLVTWLACLCLNMAGVSVHCRGTELTGTAGTVEVDAPCSGIKMLWFCAYLAATFASGMRFPWLRSIAILAVSVPAAISGNILRVACLYCLETGMLRGTDASTLEPFLHQAIGVVAFVLSAGIIALLALHLQKPATAKQSSSKTDARTAQKSQPEQAGSTPRKQTGYSAYATAALYGLMIVVACAPLQQRARNSESIAGNYDWPDRFENRTLTRLALTAEQEQFLCGFPGQIRLFTDGAHTIIWRIVVKESRQVHPSCDCYRGMGYTVELKPAFLQSNGIRWGSFEASRGSEKLIVRETIIAPDNTSWIDVSSWYWDAILKHTSGPWRVITVVEPVK